MRTCPRCQKSVSATAKHCGYCGFLLPLSSRTCPNGHPLDPNFTGECPTCAAQAAAPPSGRLRTPTQFSTPEPPPAAAAMVAAVPSPPATPPAATPPAATPPAATPPPVPVATPQPPPLPTPAPTPPSSQRSKTVFLGSAAPSADPGAPHAEKPPERTIVGVLITYRWKPEGELFPVRIGRNIIGRDPAECDIAVPQDAALSAKNTFIVYRKSFVIADAMSMGGTDVNGEPVEEQRRLPNYATIRTGNTIWTFISFDPQEDEVGG